MKKKQRSLSKDEVLVLTKLAREVQANAYAPYSKFRVGAILQSGRNLFTGCNVENASYGATICAERGALMKAISQGHKRFDRLVIVADSTKPIVPCGMCLQVLSEFCGPHLEIWAAGRRGRVQPAGVLGDYLPNQFDSKYL